MFSVTLHMSTVSACRNIDIGGYLLYLTVTHPASRLAMSVPSPWVTSTESGRGTVWDPAETVSTEEWDVGFSEVRCDTSISRQQLRCGPLHGLHQELASAGNTDGQVNVEKIVYIKKYFDLKKMLS